VGCCIYKVNKRNVYSPPLYAIEVNLKNEKRKTKILPSRSLKQYTFISAMLICAICTLYCERGFSQYYQWAKRMGGTLDDRGYSIALSNSGNIYITGAFQDTADFDPSAGTQNLTSFGGSDVFFAKYDSDGNYIWAKSIGGSSTDRAFCIALSNSGNVFIAGMFSGTVDFDPDTGTLNLTSVGAGDMFFAKYDNSGGFLWAKSVGGTLGDYVYSITVDSSENVYITGEFAATVDFDPDTGTQNLTSAGGGSDGFFAKYDTYGSYLWANSLGSTLSDRSWDIALDDSSNVYITGYFHNTVDFDPGPGAQNLISAGGSDIFFAKYDTYGIYLWANNVGSTSDEYSWSIAVDNIGSVYLAGYFEGTADFDPDTGTYNLTSVGSFDVFFAKYNNSGNYLWAKNVGGTSFDAGTCIALDDSGYIYLTGNFQGTADFDPDGGTQNLTSAGSYDIFFAVYDNNGTYLWAKKVGGTSNDIGSSIAVDNIENVYVTGRFLGNAYFEPDSLSSTGSYDIYFAKYSPNCISYSNNDPLVAFCNGDSAFIYGKYETAAGIYYDSLTTVYGCDSIHSTLLSVYAAYTISDSAIIICDGDSSLIYGTHRIVAGTYFDSLTTVVGCDSIHSTLLSVNPTYAISDSTISICDGDSSLIYGAYRTTAGTYFDSLTTVDGCDSIMETSLTVDQLPSVSFAGLDSIYCSTDAGVTLTGVPVDGTFSGTGGIAGNKFFPATGVGVYAVTYSYTDSLGCSKSVSQSVTVVQCTGVMEEDGISQLKIYPNPNTGEFTISLNTESAQNFEFKIFNNLGEQVSSEKLRLSKGFSEKRLDLNGRAAGTYNVQIISAGETINRVIIIE